MVFGKWFKDDNGNTARRMVNELNATFPPEFCAIGTGRAAALRRKGVEHVLKSVATLRRESRPGMLGRLLFARVFQRELSACGYPKEFSRQIVAAALIELTRPIA